VVTKRVAARVLCAGIASASLLIAGCGAEDAVSGFAGGTSSRDKKGQAPSPPIPSMTQSSANPQAEGAPRVDAPVPASKVPATSPPAPESNAATRTAGEPLRTEKQLYTAAQRRDPFRSLISSDQDRTEVVDLSVVTLVGVVWAQPAPFCLVEDTEGISYVLRKGDPVKNGRIVAVHRDKLVASQTILGYTTTVQLMLDKEKGRTHG